MARGLGVIDCRLSEMIEMYNIYPCDKAQESLAYFLKAAKVDPGSWVPFLYLGLYYKSLKSPQGLEKARKCLQVND